MNFGSRSSVTSFLMMLLLGFEILTDQIASSYNPTPSMNTNQRRRFLRDAFVGTLATTTVVTAAQQAVAATTKSRTDGYAIQHTDREWAYILSGAQYNILRQGGTERQKSSILNTFTSDNIGIYVCAGCDTPLFASDAKFSSGTGWPSFASALPGVEFEQLDPLTATLGGRELRCGTCGGHLGDLFNDGWVYVGTQASKTGQRFCIDGAALVFKPKDGGDQVFGDVAPPNKAIQYQPSMYRNPN